MTTRYTRPAFSARPTYECATCHRHYPMGGYGRERDYQDHIAAHRFWSTVRAEAVAVATWPLLLAVSLWDSLSGPRRHEDWTLPLALLVVVGALLATMIAHGGH